MSDMNSFDPEELLGYVSGAMKSFGIDADDDTMSMVSGIINKMSGMSEEELKNYSRDLTAQASELMGMDIGKMMASEEEHKKEAAEKRSEDMKNHYSPELAGKLGKLRKNTVFAYQSKDDEIECGCSKIGGKPDVPKSFVWKFGQLSDPLTFLMQINFAELHKFDYEKRFPEKGMLYFFYDIESQPWDMDDCDGKGCYVYYYNGDDELSPAEFPAECKTEFLGGQADMNCVIDECRLKFFADDSLPDYEDYMILTGDECGAMTYEATASKMLCYDVYEYSQEHIKFGGWTDSEQGGLLSQFDKDCVMLCQIPSYDSDKCGYMFGDGGKLYFYINKSALETADFSEVGFVLQCG